MSNYYLFIYNKFSSWEDARQGIGGNDGIITKNEMRSFIQGEAGDDFNTADFDRFWAALDTDVTGNITSGIRDRGALNAKEMEKLQAQYELYEKISTELNSITVPAGFDGVTVSQLRNEVFACAYNELKDHPEYTNEQIRNVLFKYVLGCTIVLFKENVLDGLIRQYDTKNQYGYDLDDAKKDEELKNLINRYLNSITDATTTEDIANKIRDIITDYFAKAGLGNGVEGLEDEYQYGSDKPLNLLQKAVIKKKMTEKITYSLVKADLSLDNDNYKELIEGIIESWIDSKIESISKWSDWEEIQTLEVDGDDWWRYLIQNELMKTPALKSFDIVKDFNSVDFYNDEGKLNAMGQTWCWEIGCFADGAWARRIIETDEYKELLQNMLAKVQSGEISTADFRHELIKEIKMNLLELMKAAEFSEKEIENALYYNYHNIAKTDGGYNSKYTKEEIKEFGRMYYNFLVSCGGDKVNDLLKQYFKDGMEGMSASKLLEKIDGIHAAIGGDLYTLVNPEPSDYNVDWTGTEDAFELASGVTDYSHNLSCSVKLGNNTVSNCTYEFSYSSPISSCSITPGSGTNMTIVTDDVNSDTNTEITIRVKRPDGTELQPVHTISVHIVKRAEFNVNNIVHDVGGMGVYNVYSAFDCDEGTANWALRKQEIKDSFKNYVSWGIYQCALKYNYCSQSEGQVARNTLCNYFNAVLDSLGDVDGYSTSQSIQKKGNTKQLFKNEKTGECMEIGGTTNVVYTYTESCMNQQSDLNASGTNKSETGVYIGIDYGDASYNVNVDTYKMAELFASFL